MDTNKDPAFEWLRIELASIKSRRFHIFDPLLPDEIFYSTGSLCIAPAGIYGSFLREFGWARFFTDHQDAPTVSVYPLRDYRKLQCRKGGSYIGFGYRGSQSVYFDERVVLDGQESMVYVVASGKATVISPGFSEWLHAAYEWGKRKYSPKLWAKVMSGPPPFSQEEERIVQARSRIAWRFMGFAEDGDALFEITNNSDMVLPYLSIGIKDSENKILIGGAWLDIGNVKPGSTAIVKRDCYKDQIHPEKLEPFELPEPIPEKKEAYWEFGRQ